MRMTKSQLRAQKIAELHAEQVEYEKNIEAAMKAASFARCSVVEELYEMFNVEPEHRTRDGKHGVVHVTTDKDESKRTARLLEAVSRLLASRDGQRIEPEVLTGGRRSNM